MSFMTIRGAVAEADVEHCGIDADKVGYAIGSLLSGKVFESVKGVGIFYATLVLAGALVLGVADKGSLDSKIALTPTMREVSAQQISTSMPHSYPFGFYQNQQ